MKPFTPLCLAVLLYAHPAQGSAQKPNIIFILADDLGWRDLGCYGSTFYKTPNIDQMAKQGIRFINAYAANPLCSPTRASLLTGQYPGRLRFTTPAGHLKRVELNPKLPPKGPPQRKAIIPGTCTRLDLKYHTIAEALKDRGYRTAHFGKWHLGWEPYQPENQGFEINMPGGSYPGPPGGYFAPHRVNGFKDGPDGEHIEDRMTQEAIAFLKANKEKPFFLNYWMFSVHAPFQAKEKLIGQYRKKVSPDSPQKSPVMGGMIHTLDSCVGKLLRAVKDLGIAENTLILFFSDNGGNMYSRVEGGAPTSNAPLRGGKATIYEGGCRVPFIAVWPGKIPKGKIRNDIVLSIDFYPTLLELTGAKPKPGQILDGISLLPVLTEGQSLKRDTYFCHFPHYTPATGNIPATSVRKGDWKLIRFYADGNKQQDRYELYDLKTDIGEKNNLAAKHPERVNELDKLIGQHLTATKALVPRPNPAYDPRAKRISPIQGWTPSRDAALRIKDQALLLTSNGNDPFISIRKLSVGRGPLTLQIRMRSTSGGKGQIFWTTPKERGFHRSRSVPFTPAHNGTAKTYRIDLPEKDRITALRIDPAQKPGDIAIEAIQLLRNNKAIQEWTFTDKK